MKNRETFSLGCDANLSFVTQISRLWRKFLGCDANLSVVTQISRLWRKWNGNKMKKRIWNEMGKGHNPDFVYHDTHRAIVILKNGTFEDTNLGARGGPGKC